MSGEQELQLMQTIAENQQKLDRLRLLPREDPYEIGTTIRWSGERRGNFARKIDDSFWWLYKESKGPVSATWESIRVQITSVTSDYEVSVWVAAEEYKDAVAEQKAKPEKDLVVSRTFFLKKRESPKEEMTTVADGVEFPDGTVVIRWRGTHRSTVTWPNLHTALAIHKKDTATEVVWAD